MCDVNTNRLCAYAKCIVLEGEYEGQEVDCSNAVNEEFGITSLATGYDAPQTLVVQFKAEHMPSITATLTLRRLCGQVALYDRSRS